MKIRKSPVLFLIGIMLLSSIALPMMTISNVPANKSQENEFMNDPVRNRFEPAADLHDYFMITNEDGYWLDAKTNGVNLNLSGYGDYSPVSLQFNFSFYDSEFEAIYVSSFGYLSFSDVSPTMSWIPSIPISGESDYWYSIGLYWGYLTGDYNVYSWSTPDFCVIQYDHYANELGTETGTYQVVLYSNGSINFNYIEVLNIWDEPVVGLNHGDNIHGSSYPVEELLGVSNYTIRFEYYIEGPELEVRLEGPSYVEIGIAHLYNATAKNLGTTTETELQLVFYLDEVMVNYTIIPSLGPVENYTHTYEFNGTAEGVQYLRVMIEPVLGEFTYDNNEDTMPIVVSIQRKYAIFQDRLPWGTISTQTILTEYGIDYDIFTSASMGIMDLSNYTRVIISSSQSTAFRQRVFDNLTWFEDYAANGGILEIHAADQTGEEWVNGALPAGLVHVHSYEEFVNINLPWHQVINVPRSYSDDELDGWGSSTHGYFSNITFGVQTVLATPDGNPVLIEFPYHDGYMIMTTQTLEYAYEFINIPFLENLYLYRPHASEHEVFIEFSTPSFLALGDDLTFDIRVVNWGTETEYDLTVTVEVNGDAIYNTVVPSLLNGSVFSHEIIYTPIFADDYEVTASVEIMPGEEITENNILTRVVIVRSEIGRILWDEGHGCYELSEFSFWITELEKMGYRVDGTSDPLNETTLSQYSALVCAEPDSNYWSNETTAIQNFVNDGGGFFAIGDSFQEPLNNLTLFAGIEWLNPGEVELWGATQNISQHAVTEGVSEIYFDSPVSYFNLSGPAIPLAYLDEYLLLTVSEVGAGRVAAIAEDNCLDNDEVGESDNMLLGKNIITWVSEGRLYNQITDVIQSPTDVTHEDTVSITCMVSDFIGVDSVTLFYRINGGEWMSLEMTMVEDSLYQATIPAQAAGALVEYYITALNVLDYITIANNDGVFYHYEVAIPTPTTTTSLVTTTSTISTSTTTTSTSVTVTPTTTNVTPPDTTMITILIIVGVGGAVLVIVIVIVMKKRS